MRAVSWCTKCRGTIKHCETQTHIHIWILTLSACCSQSGRAPVITILDHRGCVRGGANKEYTGPLANDQDDEMCVKVANPIIPLRTNGALAQVSLSFLSLPPLSLTCLSHKKVC